VGQARDDFPSHRCPFRSKHVPAEVCGQDIQRYGDDQPELDSLCVQTHSLSSGTNRVHAGSGHRRPVLLVRQSRTCVLTIDHQRLLDSTRDKGFTCLVLCGTARRIRKQRAKSFVPQSIAAPTFTLKSQLDFERAFSGCPAICTRWHETKDTRDVLGLLTYICVTDWKTMITEECMTAYPTSAWAARVWNLQTALTSSMGLHIILRTRLIEKGNRPSYFSPYRSSWCD